MAESAARRSARELVKSISKGHGWLGEKTYAKMDAVTRREVQEAMLAKDMIIGNSIIVLARELYSKDVRFIFELLQNADDNDYTKAEASGKHPSVAFHLYKQQVVIECNEDGFNEANLRAICAIGKSSKVGGHGYIGEKGIGFKSVFKVANRVLIQSGDYSFTFTFTHNTDDAGMGMISPEWVDSVDETPDEGWTRITLSLHEDSEATSRYQDILKQLNELDNTMLLFLKKLRRIDVTIYNEEYEEVSSTALFMSMNDTTHRATLTRRRSMAGEDPVTTNTYCHVTKHRATGLAKSANRTYTATEEANKNYGTAEVILAFPLTADDVPIVEAQQIFAFLPIRRLGFKFLIQTDFVTMANREDVVTSAPRNLGLLDEIAEAFITAIHEMYGHKTLRYQWMRYLTGLKDYPWDDFWKRLVDKITAKLQSAEIVEPRRRGAPRRIGGLRLIPSMSQDSNGDPLFEDLPGVSEVYISAGYKVADRNMLQDYGLNVLYQNEVLARVRHDLSLPDSRTRNPKTDADWHARAAKSINWSWVNNWADRIAETRTLELLPLSGGRWVSINAGNVYLAALDSGIAVPTDIGLDVLAATACMDPERSKLFRNLGARHATVKDARAKTLLKFSRSQTLGFFQGRSMIEFLYQTCNHQHGTFGEYDVVKLYDSTCTFHSPRQREFLFPSNDTFSPWQLSLQTKGDEDESDPILEIVSFLDEDYSEHEPSKSGILSWREWLEAAIGVRTFPRVVDENGKELSKLCRHVAEKMPRSFLGFLQYAWESEKESVLKSLLALNKLRNLVVVCDADKDSKPSYRLMRTYLPVRGLQQKVSELMGGQQDLPFPFLWLNGDTLSDDDLGIWRFLKQDLGLGSQDDARFYLDILFHIQRGTCGEGVTVERPKRVIDIYTRIHTRIGESIDRESLAEEVKDEIATEELLYAPATGDGKEEWFRPWDCLLNAPQDLQHKIPIVARYKAAFPKVDLTVIIQFFQNSLGVEKYTWKDTIRELEHLKSEHCSNPELIHAYYKSLNKARRDWITSDINSETMRQEFKDHSLVFVPGEDNNECLWVAPSECLWSSATEIQGRISLNNHYDDSLEDFFVDVLHVPRLDVNMVYDELLRVDPSRTTVKKAKDLIWQMNALLAEDEQPTGTVEKLLESPILPVRYPNGNVSLCSSKNEFCIVDRRPLMELFQDKVKMLAFDLAEVHKLRPFLEWSELGPRYLSKVVRESSVVDRDSVFSLSDPGLDVARKAQALTRVAVHVRSPRARDAQGFYDLLRKTKTLEAETISSVLTIHQDGRDFSSEKQQKEVYIDENASPLVIYVPHNEDSLEVCFLSALPKRLLAWMITDPTTNVPASRVDDSIVVCLTGILNSKSTVAVNRILDRDGIIDVNVPYLIPDEPECYANASLELSAPLRNGAGGNQPRPPPPLLSLQDDWSPASSPVGAASTPYQRLLAHVARAACATTHLPRVETVSAVPEAARGALRQSIETEGPMFAPSTGWAVTDHEKKLIGAAGELFVFELLRRALSHGHDHLDLSREVWQTPIRRLVAQGHAEYADMAPWPGEELADLVVDDDNGAAAALVRLLVAGGYLGAEWTSRARATRCYVEVKATMGACGAPFFMSDAQYRKMSELTTPDSIYMIFRVFNLGNDLIGVRIYMDPDRMRREGRLRFTADRWKVTPG